ncbi:MAG TPA: hypothetical protein VIN09_00755 [Chloroflexota bacterium]
MSVPERITETPGEAMGARPASPPVPSAIVGAFPTWEAAEDVVRRLKQAGLQRDDIVQATGDAPESRVDALKGFGVDEDTAHKAERAARDGRYLVVVRHGGRVDLVRDLLQRFGGEVLTPIPVPEGSKQ